MATLCQYSVEGLCCICITTGCIQAPSVCGTHYGSGANITGVPGTVVTGQVVFMPGTTTTPSGYLPADGSLYPVSSYTTLGACLCGFTTPEATTFMGGTNYNFSPFISWANILRIDCCPNLDDMSKTHCCAHEVIGLCNTNTYLNCNCSCWAMSLIKPITDGQLNSRDVGISCLLSAFACGVYLSPAGKFQCNNYSRPAGTFWYSPPSELNSTGCVYNPAKRQCYVATSLQDPLCCQRDGIQGTGSAYAICNFIVQVNNARNTNEYTYIGIYNASCVTNCVCNVFNTACGGATYSVCMNVQVSGNPCTSFSCYNFGSVNFLCGVAACSTNPLLGIIVRDACCTQCCLCCRNGAFYWVGGAANNGVCSTARFQSLSPYIMSSDEQHFCYQLGSTINSMNLYYYTDITGGLASILKHDTAAPQRGNLFHSRPFDVGYDRFVTFSAQHACFGVGVVAPSTCAMTLTCYPTSCIGSCCILQVKYSNPTNTWVATDSDSNIWTSPGACGFCWTLRVCGATCHAATTTSIQNLDNKVAVLTACGAILVSCDGTTWNCIYNKDKMVAFDQSPRLVKHGNYYLGSSTIYSCDLCCSGLTIAPGPIWFSKGINALASIGGGTLPCAATCKGNDSGITSSGGYSGIETAIWCSNPNLYDNIWWKYKQTQFFCTCSTPCGSKQVQPQSIVVNPVLDIVYSTYKLADAVSCVNCHVVNRYTMQGGVSTEISLLCWCGSAPCACGNSTLISAASFSSYEGLAYAAYVSCTAGGSGTNVRWGSICIANCVPTSLYACAVGNGVGAPVCLMQGGPFISFAAEANVFTSLGFSERGLICTCNVSTFVKTPFYIGDSSIPCWNPATTGMNARYSDAPFTSGCSYFVPLPIAGTIANRSQRSIYCETAETGETITAPSAFTGFTSMGLQQAARVPYNFSSINGEPCIRGTCTTNYPQTTSCALGNNKQVAIVNGIVRTAWGSVTPCFDTTTCFSVPKLPTGYYIKT